MIKIKVLGPGCRNCVMLEQRTREALEGLGVEVEVEKVTDMATIVGYSLMSTPGLVVGDEVVVSGKVPTTRQLTKLLASRVEDPSA